jgi:hypothetical protein
MNRDRDAQTLFAVRGLLLIGALSVAVAFTIVGVARIAAPGHHIGRFAMDVAWPVGALLALALLYLRRHKHPL